MFDRIQGTQGMSGRPWEAPAPLTDDQKSQIQSILSQYDSKNLTASDAKAIFKAFREAGIGPSPDLRQAISSAGFDPEQLRSLAQPEGSQGHHHHHHGAQGAGGSGQASDQSLNTSALQSLQSILGQYDLTNLSADQQASLTKQLSDAGLLHYGYSIDLSA